MQQVADIKDERVARTAAGAEQLLRRFQWCGEIRKAELGFALPGVFGLFHYEFVPTQPGVPSAVWVIFGDLPPCYLAPTNVPDWRAALAAYVSKMSAWVANVSAGGNGNGILPIGIDATPEIAREVEKRINFIRTHVLADQSIGEVYL